MRKFIFAILLLSLTSYAQTQTGKVVVPKSELMVNIVASETTDFINSWLSTPFNVKPYIKEVREVIPDQTFYVAFLISGFKSDIKGHYNFIVHWTLYKPDGSIMLEQKNYARGIGIMPDKPSFIMADPALDLMLEKADPLGIYRLVAIVEDRVTNIKSESEKKIVLVKIKNESSESKKEGKVIWLPANSAAELDSLWKVFYSTNKSEPLLRIFKTLIYCSDRADINAFTIGSTAKYSFIAYGKNDVRLPKFLESIYDKYPDLLKKEIDDIIAKIADKDGLEKHKEETIRTMKQIADNNKNK